MGKKCAEKVCCTYKIVVLHIRPFAFWCCCFLRRRQILFMSQTFAFFTITLLKSISEKDNMSETFASFCFSFRFNFHEIKSLSKKLSVPRSSYCTNLFNSTPFCRYGVQGKCSKWMFNFQFLFNLYVSNYYWRVMRIRFHYNYVFFQFLFSLLTTVVPHHLIILDWWFCVR